MNRMIYVAALASCLVAACGEPRADAADEAKETAAVLTGDDKAAAADNPQCKLFTAAELEPYAGEPLGDGVNAASAFACQWPAKDDTGDVMISVFEKDYHVPSNLDPTYKPVPDVGTDGFVVHELDGWAAGAITSETEAVKVSVAGNGATADTAVALLKEVIKRRGGS